MENKTQISVEKANELTKISNARTRCLRAYDGLTSILEGKTLQRVNPIAYKAAVNNIELTSNKLLDEIAVLTRKEEMLNN